MGDMADSIEMFVADYGYFPGERTTTKSKSNPQKDPKTMTTATLKNSTLISVLQATKGVRTVKVKFTENGEYLTYKTTLDLVPDQFVVCELRKAYSVGKVVFMDETPDVLNENVELKWVVQAIDTSPIEAIREEEKKLLKQIALSEAKRRLQETIQDLNLDLDMPALSLAAASAGSEVVENA